MAEGKLEGQKLMGEELREAIKARGQILQDFLVYFKDVGLHEIETRGY